MLFVEQDYRYFFLAFGIVYYIIMYLRYRNSDARHTYEKETKREIKNLKTVDTFIKTRNGLSNSTIVGANNTSVNGTTNKGMLNSLTGNKFGDSVINAALGDSVVGSVVKKSIEKKNSNKDQ